MQTAEENYLFVGASSRPVITTSGEDIRAVSWTLALGRVLAPFLKTPHVCVIGQVMVVNWSLKERLKALKKLWKN